LNGKVKDVQGLVGYGLKNLKEIIIEYWWLVALDVGFIAFFVLNGFSVVLGDKTTHKAVLHVMQLNYFLLALFIFPWGPTFYDHFQTFKVIL
jgi:DIE2/ALG10 family